MKRLQIIVASVLITLFTNTLAFSATSNIDTNYSYILMDAKTGQVILENRADEKLRPASTTKVMTAIVALENGQLDQIMNVSQQAVYDIGDGGMNIGILPGESNLTLEHMLNVMLIKSGNDTANIISENVGAGREDFIRKMNEKAKEIGAVNSYFVNPCGKDDTQLDKQQLTTPRDLAIMARYAMAIPKFREIVAKEYYNDLPVTNKHESWPPLRTSNKLLWYNNQYEYTLNEADLKYTVNGIKTGYTSGAGHNLVSSAVNEDGMELIGAVMHVTDGANNIFQFTKELYRYGFENYADKTIVKVNEVLKTIPIRDGKEEEKLDLIAKDDLIAVMPINSDENSWGIEKEENINSDIKAPVKQGDILGYIEYKKDDVVLGKVDLIASKSIEKKAELTVLGATKRSVFKVFLSVLLKVLGVLVFLFLIRTYNINRRRRKRLKEFGRWRRKNNIR